MVDVRKDFIDSLAAMQLGSKADHVSRYTKESAELDCFLNDPACQVLTMSFDHRSKKLVLSNTVGENVRDIPDKNAIFFSKTKNEPITEGNMRDVVFVSSLLDSPVATLYHSLKNVFSPTLLNNKSFSKTLDPRLQGLLAELEAGLGSALRKGGNAKTNRDTSKQDPENDNRDFMGILTLADEFQYWAEEIARSTSESSRERAVCIYEALRPISKEYGSLEQMPMAEVHDLIDTTEEVLDEIWRQTEFHPPYPQERMKHLFTVIGGSLGRCIQSQLTQVEEKPNNNPASHTSKGKKSSAVWALPYNIIHDNLKNGIAIIDKWGQKIEKLIGILWADTGGDGHYWKGAKFQDEFLIGLAKRLEEIATIRTTHEELISLLNQDSSDASSKEYTSTFEAFSGVEPVHYNSYTQGVWEACVSDYHRRMEPIEQKIAQKLREEIGTLSNSPHHLFAQFKRYKNLMKRPHIARELAAERETLLGQMMVVLKSLRQEARDCEFIDGNKGTLQIEKEYMKGKNIPCIVDAIILLQQIETKVHEMGNATQTLFSDLSGFAKASQDIRSLIEELINSKNDLFDSWVSDTNRSLNDGSDSLQLQTTGKLMELERKNGCLKVHYPDQLVTLLRQVRQLSALGFEIPNTILSAAKTGQQFYRHGVILKQVAHFYNTIDQQMIPSQKAMMLESALAFEKIVKHPTGGKLDENHGSSKITWSNPGDLENYIFKLQTAAEKLTSQNRKLRKYHLMACEKIVDLMGQDRLRKPQLWAEGVEQLRNIVVNAQKGEDINPENVTPWKTHLDHQLYKALEHQYQLGLESLNENLMEIKVELTFRQGRLQFRPPFEEIRAKYYKEMKKFSCIPMNFRGVGSSSQLFSNMIDQNASSLIVVYRKAEQLFKRLKKVKNHFKDWVLLGTVDLEYLVSQHLDSILGWEKNFKMLKSKGKDAEKLPSTIKVDCIVVSTLPVKTAIDDQMQQLFDTLIDSIRNHIQSRLSSVETFVKDGLAALSVRPQNVKEIGESNMKQKELAKAMPKISSSYKDCLEKNKFLRSVAGDGLDVTSIKSLMDKFELVLESHELMVGEQIEVLKSQVQSRVKSFIGEIEKFSAKWEQLKPKNTDMGDAKAAIDAVNNIRDRKQEYDDLLSTCTDLKEDCVHFDLDCGDLEQLQLIGKDIETFQGMWGIFEEFSQAVSEYAKEDWISFRNKSFLFDDLLAEWREKIYKRESKDAISVQVIKELDKYVEIIPHLTYVKGIDMTDQHWYEMLKLMGITTVHSVEHLKFRDILEASPFIIKNIDALKELHARAEGEVAIRKALHELDIWALDTTFIFTEYSDTDGNQLKIIKEWKSLINSVGDNRAILQSLKDSKFYESFSETVISWEEKLGELDEVLHNLNQIQRRWVYLEPIFGRGALPKERGRFSNVDVEFRDILIDISETATSERNKKRTKRNRHVISIVGGKDGFRESLFTMLDQLKRCQKALNEFLEEKRSRFPRFYFIGDEDLLEILGQSKNPLVIQSHLKKLFAGIYKVQFDSSNANILAMVSLDGEVVPLRNAVRISDNVEAWLSNLAEEMQKTLLLDLVECLESVDVHRFSSQILCLAETIQFTRRCEHAIKNNSLVTFQKELKDQLNKYTNTDISVNDVDDPEEKVKMKVLSLKLKALILDNIHMIDVVQQLLDNKVSSTESWQWQKQLRFYVDSRTKIVKMRMCDAEFDYSYEYQGNAPKLVHTPLTDKCYLTLTQGMHMGFGGNPYGPAGTGKTESVKALGVAFGRQVLVFNCDEGIDVKSMGRIFIGLVKCGAWGCFDEFNRLDEVVLSAVSQQIQIIQAALKARTEEIHLLERNVKVHPNSGIFITLNPAGKGYGGRQKLPDNLKQLFRPVAMSKPDNDLIAETILFSEGFKCAKELGVKLVSLFSLSKELLSPQQHYDWGLRALKTVLGASGNLLQKQKQMNGSNEIEPEIEAKIVVQALRVNTVSKLAYIDTQRFDDLVTDMFPHIPHSDIEYGSLMDAIKKTYEEMNLQMMKTQVKKVLELYEALIQRMGVVIVGPSGSSKSTVWKILQGALEKCQGRVKTYVMNPKAMPRQQLLGNIDIDTREWTDGILTYSARQVVKEPAEIHSWIICDGDIDPEWIESLNSVLDDNRLLTMPSGERIQFGKNVNFIFETHDLSCASPATISRMGMIFLNEEELEFKTIVKPWLESQPSSNQAALEGLMEDYFYDALNMILNLDRNVIGTTKIGILKNGISHLNQCSNRLEFLAGLIRGLGGGLDVDDRARFAEEIFKMMSEAAPDTSRPLDVYYDQKTKRLRSYQFDSSVEMKINDVGEKVILTNDLQRGIDMFTPWLENREPFILVGPEGCGKHLMLKHAFRKLKSTSIATIHCSAQTSPKHILQKIQSSCMVITSNAGRAYRPKEAERLILYLKDLNLPKPDKWGTIQLIAFLQQLVTYKGFYENETLEWVGLENIQLVGSMNPATTLGRHDLSTRFTAVVRIAYISYTDIDQLQTIYSTCLKPVFEESSNKDHMWNSQQNIHKLAGSMMNLYSQLRSKFTSDKYSHYLFTPRDLTEWVLSLTRYDLGAANVLEIWAYEACRLFKDKLVDFGCGELFEEILGSILQSDWNFKAQNFGETYFTTWGCSGTAKQSWGSTLGKLPKDDLLKVIQKGVISFEREQRDLNILIFDQVLLNISAVDRVLTKPGGSLLLAGRSGVGRRSSVCLVAHMHHMKLFTPCISAHYGIKNFHSDMKQLFESIAINSEHCVLMVEDFQIVESGILENINSLLSSGEIPGLYSAAEFEALVPHLKDKAAQAGFLGSFSDFFAHLVRQYLHIVLIMDSSNPNFSRLCESNPALYTRCTAIWRDQWDEETYSVVAKDFLEIKSKSLGVKLLSQEDDLLDGFVSLQNTCQKLGGTPRHFVAMLNSYASIFQANLEERQTKQNHLKKGLKKLKEASKLVDELKTKADTQSALLSQKQKEADQALQEITQSMESASDQKREMEGLKVKLAEEEKKQIKRKKVIEAELSEIEPLVKQAQAAVGEIRNDSLSEIRSLRMPPDVIRDILEGVLRLMGIFDTSWVSMKSFLAKRGVKEDIMHFDAHAVTPEIRASVQELLDERGDSFDEKTAKRASVAAAPLAAWVKANLMFSFVLEKIDPLERDLKQLTVSLDKSQARMEVLQAELDTVDSRIAEHKARFAKRTSEAEQLKQGLDKEMGILVAAESLLGQLVGEKERWDVQVKELTTEIKNVPNQALMAAAFCTYLPQNAEDVRAEYIEKWCQILDLDSFAFRAFMTTESQVLKWKAEGLPSDDLSVQNALVVLQKQNQVPFIVDPSSQATEWLKTHLANVHGSKLEVINLQDERFSSSVELAVRFGKTLVIQEVDEIPPLLVPLLRKDLVKQGPRHTVQIGEKAVDFSDEFSVYMTTRAPDPKLNPDIAALVNEPELEKRKSELLQQEEDLKIQLADLETTLLEQLAASEGNILENKALIDSLNDTKTKANTISSSLKESKKLQQSLDKERDAYLGLAKAGSDLYFLINDLSKINKMYQFSLPSFVRLFKLSISVKVTGSKNDSEGKIEQLRYSLIKSVFMSIIKSLFKSDRHMFALHIVHKLNPSIFEPNEWELFTGQLAALVEGTRAEAPSWCPSTRKQAFGGLCGHLPSLVQKANLSSSSWNAWIKSGTCEDNFPAEVEKVLTPFQKLLLVSTFRPDRLYTAITHFSCKFLAVKELSPPSLNFKTLLSEQSSAEEPILIMISPGSDPTTELQDLASQIVGRQSFHEVAMGQGQADIAIEKLRNCSVNGEWLCLKNLHLVINWLPDLEKEIKSLKVHKNFRLWLTTEHHDKFSAILLQNSLKVTYEAPPGVKKNLLMTYDSWTPDFISKGTPLRSQALFILAWFHAIMQERRTYIPQGWTKFYEYTRADLRAAAEIIDTLCTRSSNPQWVFVHGLFENAIYGGRVDNMYDFRVVSAYVTNFFNTEVFGMLTGGASSRLTKKLGANLALPTSNHHGDYMALINSLGDADTPSIFGLPPNVERSQQRTLSNKIISQLKILIRSHTLAEKFDRAIWEKELHPILLLWKKLNSSDSVLKSDIDKHHMHLNYSKDPVMNFIELERANSVILCKLIHQGLGTLSRVLRGSSLLTPQTQEIAKALLHRVVPSEWESEWEGPEDPLLYLTQCVMKAKCLETWIENCKSGAMYSGKFTLKFNQLFHPGTFLNALRQQTARLTKQSVESLQLHCVWKSIDGSNSQVFEKFPPSGGNSVILDEVYLEGASFDGTSLSECDATSPALSVVPSFKLAWIPKQHPPPYPSNQIITLPTYLTQERQKVVCTLNLPCIGEKATWILTGSALFLDSSS
eukprot:Nk52_evm1s338 gene=Nk52_evmTU1s338